jgi:hypothetical protein
MPSEFELRGAVNLARVAEALKAEGDTGKGFRKELRSGLVKATKPVRKELKAAIPGALPRRGGLAAEVAGSASFVLATSKSHGDAVGVRIQGRRNGRRGSSLRRMNAGTVRHPVWGNSKKWVSQTAGVDKGFLDRAFAKQEPAIKQAVLVAIQNTANRIHRSV